MTPHERILKALDPMFNLCDYKGSHGLNKMDCLKLIEALKVLTGTVNSYMNGMSAPHIVCSELVEALEQAAKILEEK